MPPAARGADGDRPGQDDLLGLDGPVACDLDEFVELGERLLVDGVDGVGAGRVG